MSADKIPQNIDKTKIKEQKKKYYKANKDKCKSTLY